ncbi:uncharacterized protein LOC132985721 isoform X2 [Labrus mixtus]|uniref:uncharacterized protein LOC132985721 isoform X2 n=1 Tax=Labrus mixtus TaxID=508554 RepID=UPI0029BFC0E9|nr:uncharacterized protein LOC132985721 isoform X2 [Labrus mixtus]
MANCGKLPIPPLPTTAYTAKGAKRTKTLAEKKALKEALNKKRDQTRVNIGDSFQRWRQLRESELLKSDAEVARFLLDRYLQTKSLSQPDSLTLYRRSSTENRDSVQYEYQLAMSSPSDDEFEVSAAPSVESSENGQESEKTDSAHQQLKIKDEDSTTHLSGNKDTDVEKNEDEVNSSFIVGDGHHMVDLGSPSEYVVDEECILQLFKSCRECNKQCKIRKQVKGLKIVINQACCYCEHRFKWTNLPDDGDSGFQTNGNKTAHGPIHSVQLQSKS